MLKERKGISPLGLEVGLLVLLAEHPAHGYELAASVEALGLPRPQTTQVYRALRRLTEVGHVAARWDTTTTSGRARRVYVPTPAGLQRVEDALEELAAEARAVRGMVRRLDRLERRSHAT